MKKAFALLVIGFSCFAFLGMTISHLNGSTVVQKKSKNFLSFESKCKKCGKKKCGGLL